ncbi:hypothetical protein MKW94_013976 [Papaver nudicaule]|uniref:BED-type domain-containing protein n=1 Tax=Papaver nudicaule TaxID=74823 RepID=A0AA41SJB1_PAPNU|nr:hypothetical protein [Papaver nudicaule]
MPKQTGSGEDDLNANVKSASKPQIVPVIRKKKRVKCLARKRTTTPTTIDVPIETENRPPAVPAARKRTCVSWADFDKIRENGKVVSGKCKHCNAIIGAKSENGTSALTKHLKSCGVFKKTQKKIDQIYLKAYEKGDGSVAAYNFKFNQEVTRDCIARMIISHELPFLFVEYIGFRRLLASLFKLVYEIEKKHLYETFSKVQSRISLTTYMWICTTQNKGYMALTAHYIDKEWRVQKNILSFTLVDE